MHPFQTRECSRIFKFVVHGDTSSSCNNNVEVATIEDWLWTVKDLQWLD